MMDETFWTGPPCLDKIRLIAPISSSVGFAKG